LGIESLHEIINDTGVIVVNFATFKNLRVKSTLFTHRNISFALEYSIRKVQEIQVGLKLNGTRQLLAYADDVNLLEDNVDTIKKNIETSIDASKEVGLEILRKRREN
jgi:hypothetical protein